MPLQAHPKFKQTTAPRADLLNHDIRPLEDASDLQPTRSPDLTSHWLEMAYMDHNCIVRLSDNRYRVWQDTIWNDVRAPAALKTSTDVSLALVDQ